ncbi:MAG: acetylglutamate kinase, partial [Pseudomonadota bacterium]
MSNSEGLHRDWPRAAKTLSEALPYILRYAGKTVLIKYGGHAMGEDELAHSFARDIVLIKQVGVKPIVVHGGGPQIGQMLDRLGIKSSFIDGLRVTDTKTVEVVEMVLAGSINKQIVSAINNAGGVAVGLSGKDGNLIQARKLRRTARDPESNIEKVLDLGFVGEPSGVNPNVLETISASDIIPVVAPIGIGAAGETYNINADTAAGALAGAVRATRLLMLTDVPGVMDENGKVMPQLSRKQALDMIRSGAIAGGMIPKVETCLEALDAGVGGVVILDGRVEHAVLLELFTEHGAG